MIDDMSIVIKLFWNIFKINNYSKDPDSNLLTQLTVEQTNSPPLGIMNNLCYLAV